MNIVDAMKSGKTVKRKPWNRFGHIEYFDRFTFTNNHTTLLEKEDVIADDWEIEEQKVEITKSQFIQAWAESAIDASKENNHLSESMTELLLRPEISANVCKKLGFKED